MTSLDDWTDEDIIKYLRSMPTRDKIMLEIICDELEERLLEVK